METKENIKSKLKMFIGTEQYYKDYLGILLTDGVKYLMEECKCCWLISDIASIWKTKNLDDFHIVEIKKVENGAVLKIKSDNGIKIKTIYKQEYEYTDFILDEIKLYLINGVLLLPNEY
tara:strand:- start:47 stop:403 length:357 start_codon:yes stop_codon:yes gene_type:complete